MLFFGLIMAEKRKNTTKMVFLLQMCTMEIIGMRIGVILVVFIILMLFFTLEVENKVEIG